MQAESLKQKIFSVILGLGIITLVILIIKRSLEFISDSVEYQIFTDVIEDGRTDWITYKSDEIPTYPKPEP